MVDAIKPNKSKPDYSEFSIFCTRCHIKIKEPSLSDYIFIAGERIVGFILLPMV